jgi:hypothetical protein
VSSDRSECSGTRICSWEDEVEFRGVIIGDEDESMDGERGVALEEPEEENMEEIEDVDTEEGDWEAEVEGIDE